MYIFSVHDVGINKESINLEEGEHRTVEMQHVKHFILKNNETVRKQLSFLNTNEKEIDSTKNNIDECHSEHLSLIEKIINENNDVINNHIMSFSDESTLPICTKKDVKVNYEHNLLNTSKTDVDLYVKDIFHNTLQENEEEKLEDVEDTEDICNMTYTQYLNKKLELESELNNTNFVSIKTISNITKDKLITITTKFNPPSQQRVVNSMKTYDISECKSSGPFFSNKVDLMKQKENSNKNNNFNDLIAFKSSLYRVTSIKLWRRMKINEFYPSGANIKSCNVKRVLAGYNSIIIQPLIHPPTPKSVRTWLRAKEYLLKKSNKDIEIRHNPGSEKDVKEVKINLSNCDKNIIEYVDNEVHNTVNKMPTVSYKHAKEELQTFNSPQYSTGSTDSLNPSLRKILEDPLLYKNNDTQHCLGISYGQIEHTVKGYSGNIADENVRNAKGPYMVNTYFEK